MKTLIAFDFDGTLYPIAPYDSEQYLMLINNRGTDRYKETVDVVKRDMEGKLGHENFNLAFGKLALGATEDDIEEVSDNLVKLIQVDEYVPFCSLCERADLVTLSCGSVDLARSFLRRLGILDCFLAFHGKEFVYREGHVSQVLFPVGTFEAKADIIRAYRRKYDRIIAVGDGPTDIPMLKASDKGIIVDLTDKKREYPFERVSSIKELLERINSLL